MSVINQKIVDYYYQTSGSAAGFLGSIVSDASKTMGMIEESIKAGNTEYALTFIAKLKDEIALANSILSKYNKDGKDLEKQK